MLRLRGDYQGMGRFKDIRTGTWVEKVLRNIDQMQAMGLVQMDVLGRIDTLGREAGFHVV